MKSITLLAMVDSGTGRSPGTVGEQTPLEVGTVRGSAVPEDPRTGRGTATGPGNRERLEEIRREAEEGATVFRDRLGAFDFQSWLNGWIAIGEEHKKPGIT